MLLFPTPAELSYGEGAYCPKETAYSADLLSFYRSLKDGNADIAYVAKPAFRADEYTLVIDADGICIGFGEESGKFRALTTLRQMLKGDAALKHCNIHDYPLTKFRGYMLSVGWATFTMDTLKEFVDLLADLKYNELYLYMDNVRCYRYDAFPQYSEGFETLTGEDIEELDRYCKERFVDLVPLQNSMGHMESWLAQPEFAHLGLGDGTNRMTCLNPLDERTFEFIEKIYDSLLPHFSSKKVLVGLDEVNDLDKYQTEEYVKEKGIAYVFTEYLNKIAKLCKEKYGKTIMFFNDMLRPHPDGYFSIEDKDVTAMCWGYDLGPTQKTEKRVMDIAKSGLPFYVCPGDCNWNTYTGRYDTMNFNLRTMSELAKDHGAQGYLLTNWGNTFYIWRVIPVALAGQFAWNDGGFQNGGKMKRHLTFAAEQYVDEYFFNGENVSRVLRRLAQTYLHETFRAHNGVVADYVFSMPWDATYNRVGDFDILRSGDKFNTDNVIWYVNRCLEDLETLTVPEDWKLEIVNAAKKTILANEMYRIRLDKTVTEEKKQELLALMDEIEEGHKKAWLNRYFKAGMEDYLKTMKARKADMLAL